MSTATPKLRHPRWRILGTLTTTTPLHIGSGDVISFDHPHLKYRDEENNDVLSDVQAVVRDHQGCPCIPGSALKGVLRSWAEQRLPAGSEQLVRRIFGPREAAGKNSNVEAGWAEFCTGFVVPPSENDCARFAENVPYWHPAAFTGILSHVCIDREYGTAAHNKLYFEEFVPEGVAFKVEINATRLSETEVALLLAILQQGTSHLTHPCQFGANNADGWGRMKWDFVSVHRCDRQPDEVASIGFDCCRDIVSLEPACLTPTVPQHVSFDLLLACDGPLLVNDAFRTKHDGMSKAELLRHSNFSAMRSYDGKTWLPASSLRGALRERAEFLLRSLNPAASGDPGQAAGNGPVERLFGKTSQLSALLILEPRETTQTKPRKQELVAIDRFVGGAADGAKFDASYADCPQFRTTITLNLKNIEPVDWALLRRTVQDLCEGQLAVRWGGAKGFGRMSGQMFNWRSVDVGPDSKIPDSVLVASPGDQACQWLSDRLAELYQPDRQAGSSAMLEGQLIAAQKRGRNNTITWAYTVSIIDANGQSRPIPVDRNMIPESMLDRPLRNISVGIEIRDETVTRLVLSGDSTSRFQSPTVPPQPNNGSSFANPYYFLRMADRETWKQIAPSLADAPHVPHFRFAAGRYSGRLRGRMTVVTPLLACDDAHRTPHPTTADHYVYPVRRDSGKRPLIASSSVRGMLRSAFEAVTNSRFGVFPGKQATRGMPAEKHGRRPGFRQPARLNTVPVRIVSDPNSPTGLAAELLCGTSTLEPNGMIPQSQALAAAWLGRYPRSMISNPDRLALEHRTEVWAYLTPQHYHRVLSGNRPDIHFDFWNVEEVRVCAPGSAKPASVAALVGSTSRRAKPSNWSAPDWYRGFICETLNNMQGKHDERFFFSKTASQNAQLHPHNLTQWWQLIENYQDQHLRELDAGRTAPPPLSPPNVYSRHVSAGASSVNLAERELNAGDLCYAEVEQSGSAWTINALYPVMISRKLYSRSPLDLLPESLRPATDEAELSPADRVFGWVNQDKQKSQGESKSAYRSNVRVSPIRCLTNPDEAVDEFDAKVLAILGQPKPQQGRFYVGDHDGKSQPGGRSKEDAGYSSDNRLRGPKVFPHHKLAENYNDHRQWERDNPNAFAAVPSSQNRSVTGWIRPETVFEFDLDVKNISETELGALLWLLQMKEGHHLRLGLGKPLGFGSVRVELDEDNSRVADGKDWIGSLRSWNGQPVSTVNFEKLRSRYEQTIGSVNPELLVSFGKAASGLGRLPIHYPRTLNQTNPNEHFEWFVDNEKGRFSLPDLLPDASLPSTPS